MPKLEYALVTDSLPTAVKVNEALLETEIAFTYEEYNGLYSHRIHNVRIDELARLVERIQGRGIPVSVQVQGNSL